MRILYPSVGLQTLCRLFGLSRQAYYEFIKRSMHNKLRDERVLLMIKAMREVHPRIGTRKMYEVLKPEMEQQGISIGRDRLFDILSENQMLIRKRRRQIRTTNSYHHYHKYKNLIKDFTPYKSNQVWVSDITYVKTKEEFYYLFLITDAYSRKIVGYEVARDLGSNHAINALNKATKQQSDLEGLIHHSDRGIQYCSRNYVKVCQDYNIQLSMTEDGNPLDNAIAERINGILKQEYISASNPIDYLSLKKCVDQAVYKYNQLRPHLSCDMKTPNQAHKRTGVLKKRWKNYFTAKTKIIN